MNFSIDIHLTNKEFPEELQLRELLKVRRPAIALKETHLSNEVDKIPQTSQGEE